MPAHLRSLVRPCHWTGCAGTATKALYNTHNGHVADYCDIHAERGLREWLQKVEENSFRDRSEHDGR